jgi:hypothetical protein
MHDEKEVLVQGWKIRKNEEGEPPEHGGEWRTERGKGDVRVVVKIITRWNKGGREVTTVWREKNAWRRRGYVGAVAKNEETNENGSRHGIGVWEPPPSPKPPPTTIPLTLRSINWVYCGPGLPLLFVSEFYWLKFGGNRTRNDRQITISVKGLNQNLQKETI